MAGVEAQVAGVFGPASSRRKGVAVGGRAVGRRWCWVMVEVPEQQQVVASLVVVLRHHGGEEAGAAASEQRLRFGV